MLDSERRTSTKPHGTWESCGRCPAQWGHVCECTSAALAGLHAPCAGSHAKSNCLNHSEKKRGISTAQSSFGRGEGEDVLKKISYMFTNYSIGRNNGISLSPPSLSFPTNILSQELVVQSLIPVNPQSNLQVDCPVHKLTCVYLIPVSSKTIIV